MTPNFDRFVAPARAHPEVWKLGLGIVVTVVVYILWCLALFGIAWILLGEQGTYTLLAEIERGNTRLSVLVILATFVGMAAGPMVAARLVHKRSVRTLFGAPFRMVQFALAAVVTAGIFSASYLLLPDGFDPVANLPMNIWLTFLPLALVGLLIQTGAEELIFRGYLQQQLAARFANPVIWLILPSLLFGFLHFDPEAGNNTWLIVGVTAVFGLLAADLTARTGSIAAAWGFHFINNVFALTILAIENQISGLALFTTPFGITDTATLQPLLFRDIGVSLAIWLVLRLLLKRA